MNMIDISVISLGAMFILIDWAATFYFRKR